ncbi:hypothetical protein EHS25_001922 [Saitozyma podzolica]|jgi:hypothetical protein|uniref:Uncharacterized protein n=1 Tax=Saitozyma podzolica TaxID=1890683 RepID=A0A427YFR7_9TREE|nr:hypothetical protein EHS25_001922 [Saitozyma podzolica]
MKPPLHGPHRSCRKKLCDFRYAEWLDEARTKRKRILWIPGKGPATATASPDTSEAATTAPAPWLFRIRAIDIPPKVKNEEEVVRRRRTLHGWSERRALNAGRPPRIRLLNRNPGRDDSDSQRPIQSPLRSRMEPGTTVTAPQAETGHTAETSHMVETKSGDKKRLIVSGEMGIQDDEQRPICRAQSGSSREKQAGYRSARVQTNTC